MTTAFDGKHAHSTTAWALTRNNVFAGRLVANHTPSGVTVTLVLFHSSKHPAKMATARVTGYGFCKFSAAADKVLSELNFKCDVAGKGPEVVERFLESQGYNVLRVIG